MVDKSQHIAEIIDNLRRVFQVVHGHSKHAERETGLTGPQLWAIKVVADAGTIRVSDLARRMYLHPATTVGIIDRLEAKGLVSRTRSESDRRVVRVELTEAGKQIVARAPEVAQGLLVSGLETFTPAKLKKISEALDHMVKLLGAQAIPPRLFLSSEINQPRAPRKKRFPNQEGASL